jgi:hypothetical protein
MFYSLALASFQQDHDYRALGSFICIERASNAGLGALQCEIDKIVLIMMLNLKNCRNSVDGVCLHESTYLRAACL